MNRANLNHAASEITLLTRMFWPDAFGGVERRTKHMAESFTGAGLSTSVITLHHEAKPSEDRQSPGYKVYRYPQPNVGWQWRWREWVAARHWASLIRQHPSDGWYWATEPVSALGAILAGRGDRLVYNPPWCAAMMQRVYKARPEAWTQKTRLLLRLIERWVYRRSAKVVTASDNLRQQYFDTLGQRDQVHVVHHGVELPELDPSEGEALRAKLGIAPNRFLVGSVSRIDPMKDFAFLLHALSSDSKIKADLLIAGEGPERERLAALAASLGLSQRVHWAGNLADPLAAYLAMDVMVLPSVYEPFGNVVREAMAAGRAVLGRRRDGNPSRPVLVANDELIEHGRTGWLVDSHEPRDLGCQLLALQNDPQMARKMGQNARQAMQTCQWYHATQDYVSLLMGKSQLGQSMQRAA